MHISFKNFGFVIFLVILLIDNSFSQILSDPLQGSTIGSMSGGSFISEGYKPGAGNNHITYTVQTPYNGYVEFEVKGFDMSDYPTVSAENLLDNSTFVVMYDGRGITQPLSFYNNYRNNYFRWEIYYNGPHFTWPIGGDRFKAKMLMASPSRSASLPAGQPAIFYNKPGTTELDVDWKNEPTGIRSNWDPNKWYTIKISWNNDTRDYKVERDGVEVWNIKKNMGEPFAGDHGYSSTSPIPRMPVDFKINLGSGPGELKNYQPNLVFRNFKVFNTGEVQNSAPTITSTPVTSGFVGVTYNYDVNTNGYPLPFYSLESSPTGMTINSSSGLIEWLPSAEGNYDVTVKATNGIDPDAIQSFSINVETQVGSAPTITTTPITTGAVGQLYTYDVNTDGNPAITYSLTTAPSGMVINSSTGVIQWTPNSEGTFDVTVMAANGISPDATQSFSINVQTLNAPVITSTPVTEGLIGKLYNYDVDTDGNPAITYSLTTFPAGMTINQINGLIQWTPSTAGSYDVTVKAANGVYPDATQSFVILVGDTTISYLRIVQDTVLIEHTSGEINLTIESNVNWSLSSNENWISVLPNDSSGNADMVVSFQQNNSDVERQGTIIVSNDSLTASATIIQAGITYYLNISPKSWPVSKNSGTAIFNIESNHEWRTNSKSSWLSPSIIDTIGNASLFATFQPNPDTVKRTGIIYITSDYFSDSVSVVQDGQMIVDVSNTSNIPNEFILRQNYPNPFNPSTSIGFSLPVTSSVVFTIFSSLGEILYEINNARYFAGEHQIDFNGLNFTSGIYFYSIRAIGDNGEQFISTKKMILIK